MGNVSKLVNVSILILAILIGVYLWLNQAPTLSEIYLQDHYWGEKSWKVGDPVPKDDEKLKPFKISVPDSVLSDLQVRLNRTRIVSSLPGVNFNYGFNSHTLEKVINYWKNNYDWKTNEKLINKYANYKTQIEGIDIHYIHVKSIGAKSKLTVPLMMCHGWPGSVVEFLKIIPLLNTGSEVSFELIIPSLPGYGWSSAPSKPGLNAIHTARIFAKLMTRLGHAHFFFHGGDWGALVGKFISLLYPNRVVGFHTTMPFVPLAGFDLVKLGIGEMVPSLIYDDPVDASKLHPLKDKLLFLIRESGYMHLQSTKPDTLGATLNDSPAGLAAYIMEKFSTWTNPSLINQPDGAILNPKLIKFTLDEMITNVMVYWVTGSITSSQRFYKENAPLLAASEQRIPIESNVAIAVSCFKNELLCYPKVYLKSVFTNLVQYKDHSDGGHFAAFELPEVVASDLRSFVSSLSGKLWWAVST